MDDNMITMIMDDGSEVEFTILESTVFGGSNYILVTDAADGEDGECYIMKDVSGPEDEEFIYESVTDDSEYDALISIFRSMLEGEIDIEE